MYFSLLPRPGCWFPEKILLLVLILNAIVVSPLLKQLPSLKNPFESFTEFAYSPFSFFLDVLALRSRTTAFSLIFLVGLFVGASSYELVSHHVHEEIVDTLCQFCQNDINDLEASIFPERFLLEKNLLASTTLHSSVFLIVGNYNARAPPGN